MQLGGLCSDLAAVRGQAVVLVSDEHYDVFAVDSGSARLFAFGHHTVLSLCRPYATSRVAAHDRH